MRKQPDFAQSNLNSCEFAGDLGRDVLNSLSAHIAILNSDGIIVETNRAWQAFADSANGDSPTSFIGINYLQICDLAEGEDSGDAHTVAAGIRSVISGEVEEFLYDYPCHGPNEKHWFYMRAIRMEAQNPVKVIVSHEEITQLKLVEEALKQSKKALEDQKQNLEEANIALRVVLKQRETDKLEIEQKVLSNIKDLVFPYVEKLKRAPLRPKDKSTVAIIENHLNDIISPLLQHLSSVNILLTPQEMQIASLVKDGRSSKEIAEVLNVSETTVHFHRKNLRHKLGIKNVSTNLRTYLMSIG
jgi:DNA-binding CsgD family transcriptional regulator